MAEKYCKEFFYPENDYGCQCPDLRANGLCKRESLCSRKLNLTSEEYTILDNLRIVKEQNAKILELLQKQK